MFFLEKIAESRILEAIRDGAFDDLVGKGQPLVLTDDPDIPPELRMAYKILKMADCLPPELELQKQIITLKDMMAGMPDEAAKLQQMRRLQFFDHEAEHDASGLAIVAGAQRLQRQDT